LSSDYEGSTAQIIADEECYKVVEKKKFHKLSEDEWL